MKAIFYCFSGTGNTKRIAEEYARAFETENVEAEIKNIENADIKQKNHTI